EVAKVYPEMVQYDKQGKPFTVYYHLLTPLMLNELQKAHQRADAQEAQLASLRHTQNMQWMGFMGLALAILVGAGYVLTTQRQLALQRRTVMSGQPFSA